MLGFFLIAQFTNLFSKAIGESNENIIYAWVSAKASLLSLPISRLLETGNPPVASLYEKPIEIYEEKDFIQNSNKIIADAVLQCWQAFGSGEMPFLGKDYKNQAFCFPCAQIKFSKKIKDNYPDLDSGVGKIKFSEFIAKPIYKEGPTYNQLLKNRFYLNIVIPKNDDLHITFIASKGNTWQRFKDALTSGGIWDNIKDIGMIASVVGVSGTAGIKLLIPIASFGGYAEPIIAPGNQYFYPAVIMGDQTFILNYCNTQAKPTPPSPSRQTNLDTVQPTQNTESIGGGP